MTLTTLVTGLRASAREAAIAGAIAACIDADSPTALILEGLPDGTSRLDPNTCSAITQVARIAPGCLCCTGNLTMRVTLNRMLRRPPARLYISLATTTHIEQLRAFLTQPPYSDYLTLTPDLSV